MEICFKRESLLDIQKLLPATIKKCTADIRWVYGHSAELVLMLQEEQRTIYFELKKNNSQLSSEELSSVAAYKSAYKIRKLIEKRDINNIEDIKQLSIVEKLNISKYRPNRKKPKYEWLLNHQSELNAMIEDKYSSRSMSMYFLAVHRFLVSHTYIINVIKLQKEL